MSEEILSPTFVYRFSVPILQTKLKWNPVGVRLGQEYQLPDLTSIDKRKTFATVRVAWASNGLFFDIAVAGKLQQPWCRDSRLEDSDAIQIWIDTRNTQNIHRASRFCHRFLLMPLGAGPTKNDPFSTMLKINRAREESRNINAERIPVMSEVTTTGYRLCTFLPSQTMSGYDPLEQSKIGFTYAISDRELGCQSFTVGQEFPFNEDPSLWGTLELQP